ncbi:MAG TPA: hypothetical protein VNJ47_01410 [Nevskiales bacterium]|nr:hypothetical protein [Nevskiales bacterium]
MNRIAYLNDYAEVSTFYRAFRRWAGMTPVQYRQEKEKAKKQAVGYATSAASFLSTTLCFHARTQPMA